MSRTGPGRPGGLDPGQLSQRLPQVVDRLTPNGQLPPDGPDFGQLGSLLKGLGGLR